MFVRRHRSWTSTRGGRRRRRGASWSTPALTSARRPSCWPPPSGPYPAPVDGGQHPRPLRPLLRQRPVPAGRRSGAHRRCAEQPAADAGERAAPRGWWPRGPGGRRGPGRRRCRSTRRTTSSTTSPVLDVGGREVELRSCGRGHTDNDLVVVERRRVVFAGDLVEEGAPPASTTRSPGVAGHARPAARAGPRPGRPRARRRGRHAFVGAQREELAAMAALCRRVAAGELPADEAVRAAPFPSEFARDALALSARAAGPAGGAAPGTARPG